ncbi:MFS transporter [Candidatus Thorarchaeota archaeon]|nr:MAG: MFS transporter [Candidatus Thorarchaeota archaeon]
MSLIARVFGLENASEPGVRLARILAIILPAFAASFQISTTFWTITIAESLGNGNYVAGLGLVGFLVVLQLAIQTGLDYPTGVLGDHIGQRYVIASALLCYAGAFWLTSTLTPTSPIPVFVAIYALMGIGASQESGAFDAWFDNNYRVAVPEDKDRKQYGVFMGKVGFLWRSVSTLVLLPGSWLAVLYGRPWVFQLQTILAIVLAFVVFRLIRDLPGAREESQTKSVGEYLSLMKDGFGFLLSDRFVFMTIMGEVLIWATGTLWWTLILFPLYFAYMITDVAVSSYRTLVFIPEAVGQERSGIWAKRFDPVKWAPRFRIFEFCGFFFYVVLALNTFIFPPPFQSENPLRLTLPFTNLPIIEMPAESVLPMIIMFVLFVITDVFANLANILTQRVMIDVIPNRIRNSMYSLKPTLSILFAMPLLAFFGWLLPLGGFGITFALVSLIALAGAILIARGFSYPIPKAEIIVPAQKEEVKGIEQLEVT